MTVDVKIFKKKVSYETQDGKKQSRYNLYIRVGTEYIPIDVVYFPNDKCDGRDPSYAGRRAVVEAIADPVPDKQSGTNGKAITEAQSSPGASESNA